MHLRAGRGYPPSRGAERGGQSKRRATIRQLGDLESFVALRNDGVAEEGGPVALRPRLSPGVPLSILRAHDRSPNLGGGAGTVNGAA